MWMDASFVSVCRCFMEATSDVHSPSPSPSPSDDTRGYANIQVTLLLKFLPSPEPSGIQFTILAKPNSLSRWDAIAPAIMDALNNSGIAPPNNGLILKASH